MLDGEGFFPRTTPAVQQTGDPEAVQRELFAQVQRAIDAGIVPTHADTHMGLVLHPKFMPAYIQLALHLKIPVMVPRLSEAQLLGRGYDSDGAKWAMNVVAMMEGEGLPLVDHTHGMPLDKPEHRLDQVFTALDALQPGITHFIIHPSHDTPEARAIGSDLPSRIGDYETFMDERVREHIGKTGVQVIGYRHLKALMR